METLDLSSLDILLIGQAVMGRTETLEHYLKKRTHLLGVLAITQVFSRKNLSRFTLYRKGEKYRENVIPSILLGKNTPYKSSLLFPAYVFYAFMILFTIMRSKTKFQLLIGIGCFPTLLGVLLRRIGIVKYVVYYTLDYFPPNTKLNFDSLLRRIFMIMDSFLVKSSDVGWLISSRIVEARKKFAKLSGEINKNIIVPLGFNANLLKAAPFEMIDKNTIVFVGSTGDYHGLQLLQDSIKLIIQRLPNIKIKIIGPGPWDSFQKFVKKNNLENYFIFRGFIKHNDELFDEVSKCVLGLAIYDLSLDNPTIYADPGKPKLYAFCGIPIIITKVPSVAKEIDSRKAGIAIDYNKESFINAIEKILKDENNLKLYRSNAFAFASDYTSEAIFDKAFCDSLAIIKNN